MDAKKCTSTMHSEAKAKAMVRSSPQHNAEQTPSKGFTKLAEGLQ